MRTLIASKEKQCKLKRGQKELRKNHSDHRKRDTVKIIKLKYATQKKIRDAQSYSKLVFLM